MNPGISIQNKIVSISDLQKKLSQWRMLSKKIVFTNGCFDIIHQGHIASLLQAAEQGNILIVGVNSDSSVKRLKGDERPINDEQSRALILASLVMVDAITIFSEPSPIEIIKAIKPNVLVKGGDYKIEDIAGAKEVIEWGGKVVLNPIVEGFSTTSITNKMIK